MTMQEQDVASARVAARDLEAAVAALRRHYGDSVDLRRLLADVERIPLDLDLLAGPEPAEAPRPLEVIPEGEYPAELFVDAEHEGLGPPQR